MHIQLSSIFAAFKRHPVYADLLAVFAGLLGVLAFAPFGLFYLAPVSMALLLLVLQQTTAMRSFALGWEYGFGLMAGGIYWMHISIVQFGGISWLLAVLATLLFIMVVALYFALLGWLYGRFREGFSAGVGLLIGFPLLWGLIEWLRSWLLTGFPWLSMGYSQMDSPLAGYAPVLGVFGVSWLTAMLAGALLLLVSGSKKERLGAISLMLLITLGGGVLSKVSWTETAGEPLRVALIQGNVAQAEKWLPETVTETLETYVNLTFQHLDADLVIWPETAVPAFAHRVETSLLQPLEKRMAESDTDLLLGLPMLSADGGYVNALLRLGKDSRESYAKRHLVPFGEFMPLRFLLEPIFGWLKIPLSNFSSGLAERPLLNLAGYPAGLSICYEDAFGDEMIEALPEAAFLVNASNDAWFGQSTAPHQHLEMARMRSLESGRWMLRATNTGISALIGPKGELFSQSPQDSQHVLAGWIVPRQGATPYVLMGNMGVLGIWFGLILWLFFLHKNSLFRHE